MGAVKNMLWDQAEDFLDDLVLKIKHQGLKVSEAMKIAMGSDIAFDLIGFQDWNDLEDYLSDIEENC